MQRTQWLVRHTALANGEHITLDDLFEWIPEKHNPTECHSTLHNGVVLMFMHFEKRITFGCLTRCLDKLFTLGKGVPVPDDLQIQHIPSTVDALSIPTLRVLVSHAESKNPNFKSRQKIGFARSFFYAFCFKGVHADVQVERMLAKKFKHNVQELEDKIKRLENENRRVKELESKVSELEEENAKQAEQIMEYESIRQTSGK